MLRSPAGNSWLTGLGVEQEVVLRIAVVAVAEQRDSWRTKLHTGAVGFSALCLTDDSARLFTDGMSGSIGTATGAEAIGPRDLLATDLGVVSVDNAEVSVAAGQAGVDVVGVTYPSASHGDVVAIVSHGRFALGLPWTSATAPLKVSRSRSPTETARTARWS